MTARILLEQPKGGRGRKVNREAIIVGQPGQVELTCTVEGRCKRPRLLEAEDHCNILHSNSQPRCGLLPAHDARKVSCKDGEAKEVLVPPGL